MTGWTRRRLLRAAAAGGAIAGGGAALTAGGGNTLLAAPSVDTDARILNFFLLLEYLQEALYREGLEHGGLTDELAAYARTVGPQETEHAAYLVKRLGDRARPRPTADFGAALSSSERFQAAAIDLEETAIAAYIGQSANLTRGTVGTVGTLLSVEARQVAWLRSLAGAPPAPRAADPARKPSDVLAHLRSQGLVS
jgi:Ferritin-like domain